MFCARTKWSILEPVSLGWVNKSGSLGREVVVSKKPSNIYKVGLAREPLNGDCENFLNDRRKGLRRNYTMEDVWSSLAESCAVISFSGP